ncbi:MAG: DUF4350 domain-containing protein [Planctomycetaceae bacterium]
MERIQHRKANLIFAIGLILLVLLQFWSPVLESGNIYDTRSTAARGKKLFYLLMRAEGVELSRIDSSLSASVQELMKNQTLVLLGPGRLPSDYQWEKILDWVATGGTLFVAASHANPELTIPEVGITVVDESKPKKKEEEDNSAGSKKGKSPEEKLKEEIKSTWGEKPLNFFKSFYSSVYSSNKIAWPKGASLELEGAAERNGTTLVRCEDSLQGVEMHYNRGRIIVFANDALFSNQSLMNTENAILASKLLKYSIEKNNRQQIVSVDEWLNSTSVPKVVGLLLAPPLRNLTLLLVTLLWFFAWWKWFRFGPYLPEEESHRLNIVSHTNTVGTLYYQDYLGRYALQGYWKLLQKEIGWPHQLQHQTRTISRLARRAKRSEEEVDSLIVRTLNGVDNPNLSRTEAAHIIRELAKLRAAIFT